MDLVRVVDFQFAELFYCCEDQNDDFQALYMLDQKPEVRKNRFLDSQNLF